MTPTVIGCATAMDISGDYIPAIWNIDSDLDVTMDARVKLDPESLEILQKAARTFGGKTAPDMSYKAWEQVVGSWGRDAENAKLKDPTLDAAVFGQVTTSLNWRKIMEVGLQGFINEAQAHIDEFIATQNTDINRLYFWQAAIIVASILQGMENKDKLIAFTNTFMQQGGTHIQYNIVDAAQLKDAKVYPEKYSDLIVRMGGFSAYFTQLSPAIQDDVIDRSEFEM